MTDFTPSNDHAIAIIGLSCRFPGADTPEAFWTNLRDGVESIGVFSEEELLAAGVDRETLDNPNYVKSGTVLSNVEGFDAHFFGYTPREAEIIDPQQRLFLECAWEALERAGYLPGTRDHTIGIWAGTGVSLYLLHNLMGHRMQNIAQAYQRILNNTPDLLTGRVAYKLDLIGPVITVQSTCSTSLVAVDLACQGLLDGKCDMAMAGGVFIYLPHGTGYFYQEGMIFSPDGHCRAFDAQAQGTVVGNGAGIVVLKRLEDALADGDAIHAVIRGSAINSDGADKIGASAPSVTGQTLAIAEAQAMAEVAPETISYIEAHGTGTRLGDPIEIAALTKAFRTTAQKRRFCAIGSLKTNIGHADAAAGVGGLIKTVLALENQQIPPSLHFDTPNPEIDFANSPFYVNTALTDWKTEDAPRRAGINSFGINGSNAHVILEEAPPREPSSDSRPWQLLTLSARTPTALDAMAIRLADALEQEQHGTRPLADVAYTLSTGRKGFEYRRIAVCKNREEAIAALRAPHIPAPTIEDSSVAFLFSGQGTQSVDMGKEVYETEPVFREEVDRCCALLEPHLALDLKGLLYPQPNQRSRASEQLTQTAITQPALFVIEYALAKLWEAWGVKPKTMLGHSIGEYIAACLSGVFSLEDALALVAARGRLMQGLPAGAMLAIPTPEQKLAKELGTELSVASINHPDQCVISGPLEAIETFEKTWTTSGARRLQVSHAFHSAMMEPILASFTEAVGRVSLHPPKIPYLSNVSGDWITVGEATNPEYWARHLRGTVRFADGVGRLLKGGSNLLLEIGPGDTLTKLTRRHPDWTGKQVAISSLPVAGQRKRHGNSAMSADAFLSNALGQFWQAGGSVDWERFYINERRLRAPLPTYPFERRRCWIDPPNSQPKRVTSETITMEEERPETISVSERTESAHHPRPLLASPYLAARNRLEQELVELWQSFLGIKPIGVDDDFFELGGDSMTAVQLIARLRDALGKDLPVGSLLDTPTIATLAEKLETKGAIDHASIPSLLVEMQKGNDAIPPFFLIHPVGGHIYFYRDLVQGLGDDLPVYAIRARGMEEGETQHTSVEAMAADYLNAVRARQSHGPYRLGGASFGGMVAFEMARQLHGAGEEVSVLAMIDTPGPGFMPTRLFGEERSSEPSEQEARRLILKEMQILDEKESISGPDLQHIHQIFEINEAAMFAYRPQPWPGRILLFRALEPIRGLPEKPEQAWPELAQGGLEVIETPGNHITMNEPPNVEVIAERLRLSLQTPSNRES
uniref:Acyl transferase domain-containing protein n=1 Tax=Candidatus Kentrum sp. MB TaxID=2138164 RepID=A0A451BBG5_9GAMM|nr:MAG: Acyl transferase domain-containing protein [Candidatus Kentron sp. MB]VFK75612.1 MAG: Acyl transferase domain-containing protein [Candidatus Kentron sp. MB]